MSRIPETTERLCPKCGALKPLGEFGKDRQKKDGLTSRCKPCRREEHRAYLEQPGAKENARARAARFYAANRDAVLERTGARQRANPEANREYKRRYRLKSPQVDKQYRIEHLEDWAERSRRRRAMLRGATIGDVDLDALWTGLCGICAQRMDRTLPRTDPLSKSVDHIVPLSKGGTHEQANLQWAHLVCNIRKGASAP